MNLEDDYQQDAFRQEMLEEGREVWDSWQAHGGGPCSCGGLGTPCARCRWEAWSRIHGGVLLADAEQADALRTAAKAYREHTRVCGEGRNPSEGLWRRLRQADEVLS